jgi:hypothetical protein
VNPGHIPSKIATYVKKLVFLGAGAVARSSPPRRGSPGVGQLHRHQRYQGDLQGFLRIRDRQRHAGEPELPFQAQHRELAGFLASPEGRASQAAEQRLAAKQAAQAQAEQDELAAADAQQGGG